MGSPENDKNGASGKNAPATDDAPIEGGTEDPPIPQEVLDSMPEPVRSRVQETFAFLSAGPMQNPVTRKITSHHITQLIENDAKQGERAFEDKRASRCYTLVYVCIAVACFFGVAWMFARSDPALFQQILAFFATFVGGFGAGWGFTTFRNSSRHDGT